MTVALLHGGPRDGETVDIPWAMLRIPMPNWKGNMLDGLSEDLYKLRPPWRGQELAHYDYVDNNDRKGD